MREIVTAVRVIKPYVVEVTFVDGTQQVVDIQPFLDGPVFEPLRDPGLFAQVVADPDSGTIVWPNGADIAPEYLYYGEAGPPPGYYGEEPAEEPTGQQTGQR